ncbi:MAG TPA: hypothetical protein VK436_03460 [Methanocella sp.]|nr:hypothetical protein [Methanocella sp.]
MVDVKISLDEKSGKITAFSILGEDLKPETMELAFKSIRQSFGGNATSRQPQASAAMTKDIQDLSSGQLTIMDRLKLFLKFEYRGVWFGTIDVKDRYQHTYGEEIKISTVSTYLSRLHNEGFLERRGNKIEREYRITTLDLEKEPSIARGSQVPEKR